MYISTFVTNFSLPSRQEDCVGFNLLIIIYCNLGKVVPIVHQRGRLPGSRVKIVSLVAFYRKGRVLVRACNRGGLTTNNF